MKRNILPFIITDSQNLTSCYVRNRLLNSYVLGRQRIFYDRVDLNCVNKKR